MANSPQLHDRKAIQTSDTTGGPERPGAALAFWPLSCYKLCIIIRNQRGFPSDGAIDRKSSGQGKRDHFEPGAQARWTADRRGRRGLFRVQLLYGVREPAQYARQNLSV